MLKSDALDRCDAILKEAAKLANERLSRPQSGVLPRDGGLPEIARLQYELVSIGHYLPLEDLKKAEIILGIADRACQNDLKRN